MAISIEELAAGALDASVGPWTLAVGASALAVALAAGSARPIQRIAATSVVSVERLGQASLTGWLGAARRGWTSLVDEARAEYEAGRQPSVRPEASAMVVASASGVVPERGRIVVPEASANDAPAVSAKHIVTPPHDESAASRKRDRRGRFVRRATNGARPE
jgi:hypothetical protein